MNEGCCSWKRRGTQACCSSDPDLQDLQGYYEMSMPGATSSEGREGTLGGDRHQLPLDPGGQIHLVVP